MRHITRGGRYFRALGPSSLWSGRPDDTSFSKKYGGRWNPRGEFGALYLAATIEVARANGLQIVKKLLGSTASLDDFVDPDSFFEVQAFEVTPSSFVDAVSPKGCEALSLPLQPERGAGYEQTQQIARDAYDAGEAGVAYRSAVFADGEELAIFDKDVKHLARMRGKRRRL